MPEEQKRRLAAILLADVVGYSRLMAADDSGTLADLKALHKEVIEPSVAAHQGRVVDAPGDCILAEFPSVVEATSCAVGIQRILAKKNESISEDKCIMLRIGINLGDIIASGEKIYGDGVNIAARLEPLATPGGICVSRAVYEQVKSRLDMSFESLGEKSVKNIPDPVGVYRIALDQGFTQDSVSPSKTLEEGLEEKPSIAVLPLVNIAGDSGQDFLCDGMTDAIISCLSRSPTLFVISRNSSFSYKGKNTDVRQVGSELGVKHVLEGSVAVSGRRIRINARLINASKGFQVWSERYDRELDDIFRLQDEIVKDLMGALLSKLTVWQQAQSCAVNVTSLDSYLKLSEGYYYMNLFQKDKNYLARKKYEEAISLDQTNALAYAMCGWTYLGEFLWGFSSMSEEMVKNSEEMARLALSTDPDMDVAHTLLGYVLFTKGEVPDAIAEARKAVQLNPNNSEAYGLLGWLLYSAGELGEGIEQLDKSLLLNPHATVWQYHVTADAYHCAGNYKKAIEFNRKALGVKKDYLAGHVGLAAAYTCLGREKEAQEAVAEALRIDPRFSLEHYFSYHPFPDQGSREAFLGTLRKVGLK
jgi:TolB-like protein